MATHPTVDSLRVNSDARTQLHKIEDRALKRSGGVEDQAPKGPVPGGSGDSARFAAKRGEILGTRFRDASTSREREDQPVAATGFGRTDRSQSFAAFGDDADHDMDDPVFGDLGEHSGFGPTDEEREGKGLKVHRME